jgi:hypothetical protein
VIKLLPKGLWSALVVAVMLLAFQATSLDVVLAAHTAPASLHSVAAKAGDKITLPPESPNPNKVYFTDFGQFVANPILRFWRLNGRFNAFGGPMSRTMVDSEGHTIQYFQKTALAYYPELANTAWETRPYHIGRLYLDAQTATVKSSFPFGRVPAVATTQTRRYFEETGHTLNAGFFELYNRTGALFTWGFPLSEEYQLTLSDGKTYMVQLFERGRMIWSPDTGAIVDPNFGTEMATFNKANVGVELNPDPLPGQAKIPDYNSWSWEHWIDVNLSIQTAVFYEGDIPVRTNLVTTGQPGYSTPTGTFYILSRVPNEHMRGGTIGADDYYDLYNVLYTQYFTYAGHALHYAWWRSYFGVTGSHGCVNMDLDTSEFAWNYLNIGSRVNVHY